MPRRPHTKSRHGCERCKTRRIKCDEKGPPCGNCASRKADCRYPNDALFRHTQWPEPAQSINPPQTQVTTSKDNINDTSPPDRKELSLLHQWHKKTSQSFSTKYKTLFSDFVVDQALNHPYLMDSILALSSFHLASTTSTESSKYTKQGLHYQNNAMPVFREALENVTEENCEALFAASVILMACTVVSSFLVTDDYNSTESSAREKLLLLSPFIRGVHYIIDTGYQWLVQGPFKDLITSHPETESLSPNHSPTPIHHLKHLLHNPQNPNPDPSSQNTYLHAITLLETCFTDKIMAIPWLLMAGDDFIAKIQEEEPLALIIYMYWGVLLDRLENIWWARFVGRKLVVDVAGLGGFDGELEGVVDWARREVGIH